MILNWLEKEYYLNRHMCISQKRTGLKRSYHHLLNTDDFMFSNQSRESTMEEPHSHIIMPALFCKVFEQLCRKCSHWSKKMQTNFYRRQNCTIANCIYIKMPDDLSQIFFSIGPIGKERVRLFTISMCSIG